MHSPTRESYVLVFILCALHWMNCLLLSMYLYYVLFWNSTNMSDHLWFIQALIIFVSQANMHQNTSGVSCSYLLFLGTVKEVSRKAPPTTLLHDFWGCNVLCPVQSHGLISTHRGSSFSQFARKSARSRWSLFKDTIIAVGWSHSVFLDIYCRNSREPLTYRGPIWSNTLKENEESGTVRQIYNLFH